MKKQEESNPIIDRIKKLMALSQSSNQHEAALAAQRCQDLLLEHNLTMAEVNSASIQSNASATSAKRERTSHDKSAMYKYQKDLMAVLAKNNFCMHWESEEWKADPKGSKLRMFHSHNSCDGKNDQDKGRIVKVHMLLGREDNVMVTRMMYDYLIETMDRLLPWQGMDKRGKDALLWLAGCTETLVQRLDEQRYQKEQETKKRQQEAAARGEAGLVKLSDLYNTEEELNQDARWGYEPGTTTRNRMEREARYAAQREKERELVAQGMDASDAWYVARGMEAPGKSKLEGKTETDAQRRKREQREANESRRRHAAWDRQAHADWMKRNTEAYRHGAKTGHNIGLDQQVGSASDKRRLG